MSRSFAGLKKSSKESAPASTWPSSSAASVCKRGSIPLLVICKRPNGNAHALVAISLERELHAFKNDDRDLFHVLTAADPAALFADKAALLGAVRCRPAHNTSSPSNARVSPDLSRNRPPPVNRVDGFLSFDHAVAAGLECILANELWYVIDVACEQSSSAYTLETDDLAVLAHGVWLRRRWQDWARAWPTRTNQRGRSRPMIASPQPLHAAWLEFMRATSWHDSMQSRCEYLQAKIGESRQFSNSAGRQNLWRRDRQNPVAWALREDSLRPGRSVKELHDTLCRAADELKRAVPGRSGLFRSRPGPALPGGGDEPRMAGEKALLRSVFLGVSGSHGSGKSHLIDSLARAAAATALSLHGSRCP